MTGNDILNRALGILGYAENNGNTQLTQRILQRALPLINLVYGDIARMCGFTDKELTDLNQKFELSAKAANLFVCGVAAYIAGTEGDDSAHNLWMSEYQARKTTLSKTTEYKDVLPNVN